MAASAGRTRGLYEPLDAFVVRAPLLPVERYLELASPAGADRPGDGLRPTDGVARLAVLIASPALAAALDRDTPGRGRDAASRSSLLRYLIRMSTRPTPYGLFAGVALGAWADRTDLALADGPRRTRTRPDMGWLLRLVLTLEADPEVRRHLRLLANACAAEQDGRVTLADRATGGRGPGPDVSVRATPVVRRVLALARRPVAYGALVAGVAAATPGAPVERVAGLVDELWRQDLLVTDLRPPPFGDPARYVAERLSRMEPARQTAARLVAALDEAAAFDRLGVGEAAAVLPRLRQRLRAIPAGDTDPEAEVVQVDAALTLAGRRLSSEVAREAARATELLLRLHPAPGGPASLAAYRSAFQARYGHDRWVPLLELLDPRTGLGLPEAVARRRPHRHAPTGRSGDVPRDDLLLDLATEALASGKLEVEFDEGLLAALATWKPDPSSLPPSLELSALVLARSPEALDRGEFRLMVGPNLGASAAGRGVGRFADLLGAPAERLLEAVATAEQARQPGRIAAELAYVPLRHRSANVTVRPRHRGYELPVGVPPTLPDDRVVRPDELAVGVRDGRLRLWWAPRGVEVVVTSGHMLNPHGAPDLCRFLLEVGYDGVTTPTGFSWGLAEGLPFLPRVRAGRLVLRPARWRQPHGLALARLQPDDEGRFAAALADWRRRWRVPRHVHLAAGDNRLLLDLDDPAQAAQLRQQLRRGRGGDLVLEEALPGPGDAWLPGPGGRYAVEVVVPLVRRERGHATGTPATTDPSARPRAFADSDRRKPPGSDWLFLSLYGPRADEDELLAGPVREFAAGLVDTGQVDGWLFVRYADPEPHLRLRFHGAPSSLASAVLPSAAVWAAGLVAGGRRARFGVEVYERELERYGGPEATALAETLFCADSAATADLLRRLRAEASRLDRTELAVLSVDDLLDSLGMDLAARARWCAEDGRSPVGGPEYREGKERLRRLLAGTDGALGEAHAGVLATLAERRRAAAPVAARLAALAGAGELTRPLPALLRSYVHLHCNRLLGPEAEAEWLALGLLRRTLASLVAAPLPVARVR
jgi:thiopeptide-type bacteriocin biosynthesis protein